MEKFRDYINESEIFKDEYEVQDFVEDLVKKDILNFKHVIELVERLPKKPLFLHNIKKNYTIKDSKGWDGSVILIGKQSSDKYYIELDYNGKFLEVYKQSEPRQRFNKFPFYKEIVVSDLF